MLTIEEKNKRQDMDDDEDRDDDEDMADNFWFSDHDPR